MNLPAGPRQPGQARSRFRTPVLFLGGAILFTGCATYHSRPLPDPAARLSTPAPTEERLRVAAAELDHPLLKPLALDLSDGLSPEEAAVLAVLANPSLAAVRDRHGEAAAQLVVAGLLPNPDLSAELDHPHGAGSGGTTDVYNLGLGISVSGWIGRAARVAEASATLKAVDLGIAWQEWRTGQGAGLAVVRMAGLRRRLDLIRREVSFEKETVKTMEGAVQNGDATIQALGVHRGALGSLLQLEGDLQREAAVTRSRLNLLLGLPPESRIQPVAPESPDRFQPLQPVDTQLLRSQSVERR